VIMDGVVAQALKWLLQIRDCVITANGKLDVVPMVKDVFDPATRYAVKFWKMSR